MVNIAHSENARMIGSRIKPNLCAIRARLELVVRGYVEACLQLEWGRVRVNPFIMRHSNKVISTV